MFIDNLTYEDRKILGKLKNATWLDSYEYANLSVIPTRTFMEHGGVANCVASQINLVHQFLHTQDDPKERY